jgi:hypothetical protein
MVIDKDTIVNFVALHGKDHKGRRYVDYLAFSDNELEINHDFIQWMFPLHEPSGFSGNCPILSPEIVEETTRLLNFKYQIEAGVGRISRFLGIGQHFDIDIQRNHFHNGNHNLLRITRIIRSLRLLEREDLAKQFYDDVMVGAMLAQPEISAVTRQYWIKALTDDAWETMK